MVPNPLKKCSVCGEMKPLKEFYNKKIQKMEKVTGVKVVITKLDKNGNKTILKELKNQHILETLRKGME